MGPGGFPAGGGEFHPRRPRLRPGRAAAPVRISRTEPMGMNGRHRFGMLFVGLAYGARLVDLGSFYSRRWVNCFTTEDGEPLLAGSMRFNRRKWRKQRWQGIEIRSRDLFVPSEAGVTGSFSAFSVAPMKLTSVNPTFGVRV